jgi:hypothetical protein
MVVRFSTIDQLPVFVVAISGSGNDGDACLNGLYNEFLTEF